MAFCSNCGRELIDTFIFCPECGNKVIETTDKSAASAVNFNTYHGKMKICLKCGREMPEDSFYCLNCGNLFQECENEFEAIKRQVSMQTGTWKSKWVSLLLCVFFGGVGAHRFYEGKIFTGLLYLFTFGFMGVGWVIDIVRIAMKPDPYRVK